MISKIPGQRPVLHIVAIELDHVRIVDIATSPDLPGACQPWQYLEPAGIAVRIKFLKLITISQLERARANQTHFASENIHKLRQFVEARTPQETPQRRDSGVVSELEKNAMLRLIVLFQLAQPLLGIDDHGSEFEYVEKAPMTAATKLAKQNRAR